MKQTILLVARLAVVMVAVVVGCKVYLGIDLAHHKAHITGPAAPRS